MARTLRIASARFTDRQTSDWVCETGVGQGMVACKPSRSEVMTPSLPSARLPPLPCPGCP